MQRLVALWLVLSAGACALVAQSVGSTAPDKVFLNQWNVAAGVARLVDYQAVGSAGTVVLLDWWGAT